MKKIFLVLLVLTVSFVVFAEGGKDSEVKVLNRYVVSKLQPFDPADMTDLYTSLVYGDVAEALYSYKYLTDTYQLQPEVAKAMPTVSDDGLTYTIKLRDDIYYYDPLHEVFDDYSRKVMAKDFVLSIKRLADPETNSGGWWLYEGYIEGLDEWAAEGADYSKTVSGFKALDDFTLQLTLTKPYPQILYTFAMPFTYPVTQEALDFYGESWKNYPIGSGAYAYSHEESIPGSQHVLVKNPTWKGGKFPAASTAGDAVKAKLGSVLNDLEGDALPFMDKVVWYVIEESSVQWLKFLNGELDYSTIPKDNFDSTVVNGMLSDDMAADGITLDVNSTLDVTYTFFNMEDPIVGGYTPDKLALRRAMSLGYQHEAVTEIFYNNTATPAQTLLPPGLGGYDPDYVNPYAHYDLDKAKQLLAEAGYPGGKGLPVLKYQMYSNSSTTHRQMVEFFIENMSQLGIQVEAVPGDWPTFLQRIDNKEVQIGGIAWGADYPDAQNFLQLNYGPNKAPGPNAANYDNPKFNALYEKGAFMQQSPERDKIYAEAAQLAAEDVPWIMGVHRQSFALEQPWLKDRVFRDIGAGYSKYLYIDTEERGF